MGEILRVVIPAVAVIAMLFLAAIMLARWADRESCEAIAKSGYHVEYRGLLEGCYVNINGRWIPRENWRVEQ